MTTVAPQPEVLTERFTVRDYVRLPEGFPAELIEGGFVRELAPSYWHQGLTARIVIALQQVVDPGRVIFAPADVILDDWNVLQPDVLVRAPGDVVTGPDAVSTIPVLVVEVTSPQTARRDRERKTAIYLRSGVGEVWIVDPDAGTVEVHSRGGVARFRGGEEAASRVVDGFRLSWDGLVRLLGPAPQGPPPVPPA